MEKERRKGFHNRKAEWPALWKSWEKILNYKQLILFSVLRVSLLTNRIHKLMALSLSLVD